MSSKTLKSFISLQVDYWDGPWQNRHGFLSELAKLATVLFVSPPLHLEQVIRPRARQKTSMSGLQHVSDGLWSYVPPRILPVNHRLQSVEQVFGRIRDWDLRRNCQRLSLDTPATIVFHPHAAPWQLDAVHRPLVYYKYDHYAGYGGVPAEQSRFLDDSERRLFDAADLVFVTSRGLFELHENDAAGKIRLLPNGVDFPAFRRPIDSELVCISEFNRIPRPRLGYVGQLNEKINFGLLMDLARVRPDYSFVLIGNYRSKSAQVDRQFRDLTAMPNVIYLGPVPHREVPAYLLGLDVGLMPYVLTEWVRYGYPLKLHEYLAAGLPSVSSPLPELEPFREVVTIANSPDDWVSALDFAVRDGSDLVAKDRRRSVAQANSWEARVTDFMNVLIR